MIRRPARRRWPNRARERPSASGGARPHQRRDRRPAHSVPHYRHPASAGSAFRVGPSSSAGLSSAVCSIP